LVEAPKAVAADAAELPIHRLELAWIAWSARGMPISIFCGVAPGGAWNAASAIDHAIRAARPEGDEAVRRRRARVLCSVAQSKALLSGALNNQNAFFQVSRDVAQKLIDAVSELISIHIRYELGKIDPDDLDVVLTGLQSKL
jgi:hypothetical protein